MAVSICLCINSATCILLTAVIVLNNILERFNLNLYEVESTAGSCRERMDHPFWSVIWSVCLPVYLSVCMQHCRKTDRWNSWNYQDRSDITQGTTWNICGMLCLTHWIQKTDELIFIQFFMMCWIWHQKQSRMTILGCCPQPLDTWLLIYFLYQSLTLWEKTVEFIFM